MRVSMYCGKQKMKFETNLTVLQHLGLSKKSKILKFGIALPPCIGVDSMPYTVCKESTLSFVASSTAAVSDPSHNTSNRNKKNRVVA